MNNTFSFKAKKKNGQVISGKVKAKNKNEVLFMLVAKQLEPVHVELQKPLLKVGGGGLSGVSNKHLVTFTRQLAFLVTAGVPVIQALQIVKGLSQSAPLKIVITDIVNDIEKGSTFSSSLSSYPSIFSSVYVNMVEAGEGGGSLDVMLSRLASYIEESAQLKSKMLKAMMYPAFVLSAGGLVLAVIMMFVVPKFTSIFASSKVGLPLATQMLVTASDLLRNNIMAVLILAIFIPFVCLMYLRSPAGRPLKDQILMLLPVVGPLVLKNSLARFSRTFSCLMVGGVDVSNALGTAALTSNNFFIERSLQTVKRKVMQGKSISQSLKKEAIIPGLVTNMMAIGEETGKIDVTLEKVAEFYEEQVRTTANTISDLIQPFLIVLLGGIIGFIVIALYLPVFKLPGVAGGM